MSAYSKKNTREREIIRKLDKDIEEIRNKTNMFQEENPLAALDADVVDLSNKIHSGVLPNFKKPTIH
jgi:hypothetical protein